MGSAQSIPQPVTPRGDPEFEELWERITQSITREETPEVVYNCDFVTCGIARAQVACSVFAYLSQGKSFVTRDFLRDRIRDIKSLTNTGSDVVRFWAHLETIGLDASTIMEIMLEYDSMDPPLMESDRLEICREKFPSIEHAFNACILAILFASKINPLDTVQYVNSEILPAANRRLVNLILPQAIERKPNLLFSTKINGSSFRVLGPAIKYYSGGVLFIFETQQDRKRVFGFYTVRDEWSDTCGFDETARDSVLFQVYPEIRVRRQYRGRNYVYMNTGNVNHPIGIGLGGQEGCFRLWLDGENICQISSMESDATFEPGQLLSSCADDSFVVTVQISCIEIWGFGGSQALQRQQSRRIEQEELKQDRRKIDKSKLIDNQFNREMFFSKTFKASQSETDRLGNA
jgi:hypothetical protein